jgi:hypothetical protein
MVTLLVDSMIFLNSFPSLSKPSMQLILLLDLHIKNHISVKQIIQLRHVDTRFKWVQRIGIWWKLWNDRPYNLLACLICICFTMHPTCKSNPYDPNESY